MMRMFAAGLVAAAGLPSAALAQEQCHAICQAELSHLGHEVLCAAPVEVDAPEIIAGLDVSEGQILQAAATGFTPIEGQAGLTIGSQAVLTEGSEGLLSGPSCQVELTGPAFLDVLTVNGCGCITRTPTMTFAQEEEPEGPDIPPELVFGGLLGIGGVVGIILLAQGDGDGPPAAPPPPVSP